MNIMRVPYGQTVHGQEEIDAVVEVLKGSTQMGKNVREFEERIAALFDKKFGVMVNSGSSALLLAMLILDLPKGSEVITPVLTFGTTVSSIVQAGLVPVFVDAEEGTYCIDAEKIERLISPLTKALLIPNLIGNLPNWEKILALAQKYNLKIVEDSADTLGAMVNGRPGGYYSDISITSFYGSHIINCAGNGGMLCVNDEKLVHKAKLLRSWGRSSSLFVESEAIENRFNINLDGIEYDSKFVFEAVGYNLEPSEAGAAFGLVQLKKLADNIALRVRNFEIQSQFFKKYEDWFILPKQAANVTTGWLAYPLTIRDSAPFKRRDMQIFLEKQGIQTRVVFTGNITRQPGFKNIQMRVAPEGYPFADSVMRGGVLLAVHHGLTQAMLDYVHANFELFAAQYLANTEVSISKQVAI